MSFAQLTLIRLAAAAATSAARPALSASATSATASASPRAATAAASAAFSARASSLDLRTRAAAAAASRQCPSAPANSRGTTSAPQAPDDSTTSSPMVQWLKETNPSAFDKHTKLRADGQGTDAIELLYKCYSQAQESSTPEQREALETLQQKEHAYWGSINSEVCV